MGGGYDTHFRIFYPPSSNYDHAAVCKLTISKVLRNSRDNAMQYFRLPRSGVFSPIFAPPLTLHRTH